MSKKANFTELAERFMFVYDSDNNSRFKSYDHVHNLFRNKIKDKNISNEYLALNLFAFLASWGMLRGSGFLLQKDYLFLVPIIRLLREDRYQILMDVNPFTFDENEYISLICELKEKINGLCKGIKYWKYSKEEKKEKEHIVKYVTDTQVGKILLAVFGCIPAYDRYIKASLKEFGIKDKIDKQGLTQLISYLKANKNEIEEAVKLTNSYFKGKASYSVMKVFDMITWEYGSIIEGNGATI